jgi:hypothetical protein
MASTFTIIQQGKEELVTAYIDSSSSYLNASWWECGIYELPIKAKTNSGNSPTFNWFQYVDIEILDNFNLLKYYYKNTGDDSYMLYINPNTNNPEYCYLDDSSSENFPNGVISCIDPKPSEAAKVFEIKLKSNDETKVIIDSSNNGFTYDVSG